MKLLATIVATGALVLGVAACGGGSDSLSLDDQATVASFRSNASLVAGGSDRWYADLLDTMDATIDIAREHPDATYEDESGADLTMRQVLSDGSSTLQGSDPDLADQLDKAAQTLE